MGTVFTWDEINNGRVPQLESFPKIVDLLRSRLHQDSSILAATICGSVARGDFNRRSDVDCVVVYSTDHEKKALDLLRTLSREAAALYVPINFIPCDNVVGGTPFHHLGPSFAAHVEASHEAGAIKGRVAHFLAPSVDLHLEIESYLRNKLHNLTEGWTAFPTWGEERQVATIKKALEAPFHVARKMLTLTGNLKGDSKEEVVAQYTKTMPSGLPGQLKTLRGEDTSYTAGLEIQLESPHQPTQRAIMGLLSHAVPQAARFVRDNILWLTS